jgi:hypothetical protein
MARLPLPCGTAGPPAASGSSAGKDSAGDDVDGADVERACATDANADDKGDASDGEVFGTATWRCSSDSVACRRALPTLPSRTRSGARHTAVARQ